MTSEEKKKFDIIKEILDDLKFIVEYDKKEKED